MNLLHEKKLKVYHAATSTEDKTCLCYFYFSGGLFNFKANLFVIGYKLYYLYSQRHGDLGRILESGAGRTMLRSLFALAAFTVAYSPCAAAAAATMWLPVGCHCGVLSKLATAALFTLLTVFSRPKNK